LSDDVESFLSKRLVFEDLPTGKEDSKDLKNHDGEGDPGSINKMHYASRAGL
jgi:hypothetical protein